MAKNSEIPAGEVEYRNTLRDVNGVEDPLAGYRESVVVDPDGLSRVVKDAEFQELEDGRVLTASMLGHGKIELMVCNLCRYPAPPPWWARRREPDRPSSGILARESGALCEGCSRFVCKLHSVVVADGSVRCLPCARRFRWRAFIHALFFAPVREGR